MSLSAAAVIGLLLIVNVCAHVCVHAKIIYLFRLLAGVRKQNKVLEKYKRCIFCLMSNIYQGHLLYMSVYIQSGDYKSHHGGQESAGFCTLEIFFFLVISV